MEVRILARIVAKDVRTTTARNLRLLEMETGGLTWVASPISIRRRLLKTVTVPEMAVWRLPYLGKLLEERDQLVYQGKDDCELELLQSLIDSLCSS